MASICHLEREFNQITENEVRQEDANSEVETGDVILKVNETDVNRFSTKEVLKCLRLSADPVTLKLKRDPIIKDKVRRYLSDSAHEACDGDDSEDECAATSPSNGTDLESLLPTGGGSSDSFEEGERLQWEPLSDKFCRPPRTPRYEAFMMTGDIILNLSRTPQSCGLLPKHQKKVDSLRHRHHHRYKHHHHHNSVPNSPDEMDLGHRNSHHQPTSVASAPPGATPPSAATAFPYHHGVVRMSRSEDHLQFQKDSSMSAVDIDIDEDVTSSLNTLLDTRQDAAASGEGGGGGGGGDRIVWTYNAPVASVTSPENSTTTASSSSSTPSSEGVSPQRSLSPASPTSVSSSVMSSNSSNSRHGVAAPTPKLNDVYLHQPNGELSQSEAISNISSPDFQEEETLDILSARDLMEVSDPSDSDSTLLVSDRTSTARNGEHSSNPREHRIVIQVKGPEEGIRSPSGHGHGYSDITPERAGYQELRESEDELVTLTEDATALASVSNKAISPPLSSEDESDIESLHSFHYSPKAVDIPSAIRLAKRLYMLDGFKKSDVSRHLSKNNDFSRVVAEEYLKYFSFDNDTLDIALRKFLKQFSLTGETQERERVLVHFSKRYLDCNPGTFNSQDAVHTLTCAIMLLNTDLHGQNIGRKMTCTEFIENLSELNDGDNFPREVLKQLYQAIKSYPLEWALDEDADECSSQVKQQVDIQQSLSGSNPFLDVPNAATAVEYKKGYVMRKSCIDPNGKKTPLGKRSWKMFYCTLRDMVLYLHKDEHGFRKSALSENLHNAIRIHHALATKAADYTKKQHVFRLQTADQAEYLFQTSDSKELQSWIDTINFVCASFSAQPLAGAVGSQRKFQRPLLPCSHTKLNLREQLRDHEERVQRLEAELEEHRKHPPERSTKSLMIQNYREKEAYLHYELKRYKTYAYLLRSRISQYPDLEASIAETSIGEVDEGGAVALVEQSDMPSGNIIAASASERRGASPTTNRYSYRAAIYSGTAGNSRDNGGDIG